MMIVIKVDEKKRVSIGNVPAAQESQFRNIALSPADGLDDAFQQAESILSTAGQRDERAFTDGFNKVRSDAGPSGRT